MQKRSFLFLFTITMLLVAAAMVAVVRGDRAASRPERERRAFPELAAHLGDLAWMRLVHGTMTVDFGAIGGHWALVEKGNYPAAPGKVQRLLLGLADLTLVEPKTKRPDLFGRLGLDDPRIGHATEITLQDRMGAKLAELIVGTSRPDRLGAGNDGLYIRKPGDDQTWLARGRLDLPGDVKDWLDRRIVDIPPSRIASVTLADPDGATVILRRDAQSAPFAVAEPPGDTRFKDEATLAAPAAALAGLELDDVKPAADLAVPPTGVATAAFATFDGLTVTLRLFTQGKLDWAAFAASGNGKAAKEATRLNDSVSRWVYAIPAARAKLLRTRLSDLIAPAKGS